MADIHRIRPFFRRSPCCFPACREFAVVDRFDPGCIHHHAFTFLPTCGDAPKMPTNGGLFQCVLRVSRSPEGADGRFRTSVSAAKNPVPGAEKVWWRKLRLEAVAAGCALRLKSVDVKKWNQGWARPSRSNCSDHSAGASRKVAMPMPRGSRPSTAALTRAGAMNAIDIVMLT